MYLKKEFRFQIILHDLAKSLAADADAPWEKVKVIHSYCPQITDGSHFVINPYSLDSIIALGTYYLQSGYKHTEKIVPYLLNLLKGLATANWFHENVISEVPFAERFSFCLNTLLTEISISVNKDIFIYQINEIENIILNIVGDVKNGFNNEEDEQYFYCIKLPVFLGLAQSMIRYSSESSYFCYLFSKHKPCIGIFHHIKTNYDCPHINLFSAICEEAGKMVPKSCTHVFKRKQCSYPFKNILDIMKTLHCLLSDKMTARFENNLRKFKNQPCSISPFYFNNLIEILRCVTMSLYKELVYQSSYLTDDFTRDNKDFLDSIYSSVKGYDMLKNYDSNVENEEQMYQRLKINTLTKVTCLELLAWSARDAYEAENICLHVAPLLMFKQANKILFLNAPYMIACMDALGTLAEKFHSVSDVAIKSLQNFLSLPSPVIIDLGQNSCFTNENNLHLKKDSAVSRFKWFEYCLYKKVQNSAIENICKSLKSTIMISSDYIPAFITKFSSLLFMEKSHSHYSVIIENVVATLGHISYSMPSLSLTILQCFQQRLHRHSTESDIAIIHQLGNMLILNHSMEVFLGALKIFSNILLEVNNDSNKELNHISDNLFHVLVKVADRLQEQPKIIAAFVKFLEIFVQTSFDELRNSEFSTIEGNQTSRANRINLLHTVALLGKKLQGAHQFKKQQERLFQDFLLYFVLNKTSLTLESDYSPYVKSFVPKLPVLTSESLTDHDLRENFYMSSLNRIKISTAKQYQLKIHILNFLQSSSDVNILLNRLTLPQVIYLHSVCMLETIRIENSDEPSIESLFMYLTNLKLQKDKYGMWQCICKVAEEIFKRFLTVVSNKKRNITRDTILVKHTKLLLIHFNNSHSQIRHISDKFLSELIDSFPHLLWNRYVLWNILDILTVLYYSETIDSSNQISSLKVPNTDYSIYLMDTNKSRKEILDDFVARSRDIILEARKWQPKIVNSHLQEYLLQDKHSLAKDDPLFELRYFAWTSLCSKEKSHEITDIITSLSVRSRYAGEISGLITGSNLSSVEFGKTLATEIWKACNNQDAIEYKIWLQRAAAFVVTQPYFQHEIKQALATSHIRLFTEEVMCTVVECWTWVCAYHPHFEIELLIEVFEAWQNSADFRIGAFSNRNINENQLKGSSYIDPQPHNIWSEFIAKQTYSSVYGCHDKLEIIVSFLHSTLPMGIGGPECMMGRHIESIATRFNLLSSALSLVQSNVMTYVDKVIIRQRIYCSCLDYFCSLQNVPRENESRLKQNIEALVKFWHNLYSDKAHILKSEISKSVVDKNIINFTTSQSSECKSASVNHFTTNSFDNITLFESFSYDFVKKRKLALCLLANEIEFLSVWYNPCHRSEKTVTVEENKIKQWQSNFFSSHRSMCDFVKCAWEISPVLTVYLPNRIRQNHRIFEEISKIIVLNPTVVSHIPHAVQLLATAENVRKDCKELVHLLTWAEAQPLVALNLFSRDFPSHPFVLQYAIRTLLNCQVSDLSAYIPQLVQSVRYDSLGYIRKLLLSLVDKSQLFCHQLIWNMKSNMYVDVNLSQKSSLYERLSSLLDSIMTRLSECQKKFFDREFDFVDQITEVSSKIPRNLRADERKEACRKALQHIDIKPGCYLPSNPETIICELDYKSGTPLQSKCRTPYLAKFLVYKSDFSEVQEIGMKISRIELSGSTVDSISLCKQKPDKIIWQRTIFKAGDDVRQDVLALQTIRLLKNICNDIGLDVFLYPYNVVAIAPAMGVIECIPNAYSRDELGKQTNVGLYDYFVTTFGNEKSVRFREAQRNFIKSVAAYSIITFLLQTKDRHNGNIMIDNEGHIIHIDFGFMFESSPGGNLGFEPDMKLTEEMVMIMGGKMEAEPFQWFTELCVKTYLTARQYQEHFIVLVNLMLDSGLPCFRGQTIKLLRERFAPYASEREAADYIITVIRNSFLNFRTVTYDMLQYLQNSIQY